MNSQERFEENLKLVREFLSAELCDRCGKELKAGDWPWCQGKPEQHQNPHYGWHFAQKD